MAAVTNKTGKPLSIPLPRGKTLHLGPRKSGQISSHDIEHPGLKKLVDAGTIEIVAEDSGSTGGEGARTHGWPWRSAQRRPLNQAARGELPGATRRRQPWRRKRERPPACALRSSTRRARSRNASPVTSGSGAAGSGSSAAQFPWRSAARRETSEPREVEASRVA